jgi:anti-anti-sigma regulatory factor
MSDKEIEPFVRTPGGDLEVNIDTRDEWPGIAVLRLRGAITPRAVPVLQDIFSRLETNGIERLAVILRNADRICSSGLALLVGYCTRKGLEQDTPSIVLVDPSHQIEFTLKELGVISLFPVFKDENDGINLFLNS